MKTNVRQFIAVSASALTLAAAAAALAPQGASAANPQCVQLASEVKGLQAELPYASGYTKSVIIGEIARDTLKMDQLGC